MALTFEYERDLVDVNSKPFISYDTTSTLYQYSIDELSAIDKNANINLGAYDTIIFNGDGRHITTKSVDRIGGRNVPGVGTIAYYKDYITGDCMIVHIISYTAPEIKTLEIDGNQLHIIINTPLDVHYDCFRVILEQDNFAYEYIMHEHEDYVHLPLVKGDYTAYCFGYDESNAIISPLSSSVAINIPNGENNWTPISIKEQKELNNKVDKLSEEVGEIKEDIDDIKLNITSIENDITNINDTIGDISSLIDKMNGEVV